MSILAEVRLWGSTIGAIALADNEAVASFEYNPDFVTSGIELSPLVMPLSRTVYRFPSLARESFHGLPGLLADSLPDRFGNALIDTWLARQGRSPASFNAVERLCYTGKRGMGALEFLPVTGPESSPSDHLEMDQLVDLANAVLSQRTALQGELAPDTASQTLSQILQIGTSAGGARAKAVIAWNPQNNELRSGQLKAPLGFEYWLLKFDGVGANRDKELLDSQGYGLIEYAYYGMARAAGIQMSECRVLQEHDRNHFMTRRFDRAADGQKLHMQSLGALAHYDFNAAGAHSYEQAFGVIRSLGLAADSLEEQFRRMVFNVMARNQDDHVKNIAFLMDKRGIWSLAPAFDMTYSYQKGGLWTGQHQMSLNGRRDGFSFLDLQTVAQSAGLKRGRAASIVEEVHAAVARWREFAAAVGVSAERLEQIQAELRLDLLPIPRTA